MATSLDLSAASARTGGRRSRSAIALMAALAVACLLAGGTQATLARFNSTSTASGGLAAGTLGTPTVTLARQSASSVNVTWTAVTVSRPSAVQYYVTRDGGMPAGTCPTSSAPSGVQTCRDSGLAGGIHTYTVTVIYGGWTSTSTPVSIWPVVAFTSKLAADGYIAGTITGLYFPANTKVTMTYQFGAPIPMAFAPYGLDPTSAADGSFTVNWEDDCKDGAGTQQRTDLPVTVTATYGTTTITGTGTIVCSQYKH